jgi:hypothetical protein
MCDNPEILLCDSVTKLQDADAGCLLVTGSHGGFYTANLAARGGLKAAIFNDAGVGKDRAGIAGLIYLEKLDMAAVAVAHDSARIGDAKDMWERGVISHVNAVAARLGCAPRQSCSDCAKLLQGAARPQSVPPEAGEASHLISKNPGQPEVWVLDSASLVGPEHVGQIVLTGSHGGLLGGRPEAALKADALAAVYNDAGVGIDEAGITRLPALDARKIAGATVTAASARIGEGLSTYRDGIVSRINRAAAEAGATEGMAAVAFVACIIANSEMIKSGTGGTQ